MSAIENLKAVLLDPEGNSSVIGSKEDNEIIKSSLAKVERQLALFTYVAIRHKDIDDIIEEFTDTLKFDDVIKLAKYLDVEVNYPPLSEQYPDWQCELATEVGDAMRKIFE